MRDAVTLVTLRLRERKGHINRVAPSSRTASPAAADAAPCNCAAACGVQPQLKPKASIGAPGAGLRDRNARMMSEEPPSRIRDPGRAGIDGAGHAEAVELPKEVLGRVEPIPGRERRARDWGAPA
jgi:hypothetical protein